VQSIPPISVKLYQSEQFDFGANYTTHFGQTVPLVDSIFESHYHVVNWVNKPQFHMARKPINMHQLRLILQLAAQGRSQRKIAQQTQINRITVKGYLLRAQAVGLDLTQIHTYDDATLSSLLLKETLTATDLARYEALKALMPNMLQDIAKVGVTRLFLWQNYSKTVTDPYGYTQFCEYFSQAQIAKKAVMHFEHKAGERIMIDFAGKLLHYTDPQTGEIVTCQVFVAVLPYSKLTYVKAIPSQKVEDFLAAIVSLFSFIGGTPKTATIDNLKAGVITPDRYEPTLNNLLEQLSAYYGCVFEAARPYKPKDKAAVEGAVKITYQRIHAHFHDIIFDSLAALNEGILIKLDLHNHEPFQRNEEYSRQSLFDQVEKAELNPLPQSPFVLKQTAELKVQFNYHIFLGRDKHSYSVPYQHINQRVQVVYDTETVEIYAKGDRIAFHKRSRAQNGHTTIPAHMPENHLEYLKTQAYTSLDFLTEAAKIGPNCTNVCEQLLDARQFKEHAFKSCLGLVRLASKYTAPRLELACQRALRAATPNYQCVRNILKNNLDLQELTQAASDQTISLTPADHENLRGAEAFF
jgi:transposase